MPAELVCDPGLFKRSFGIFKGADVCQAKIFFTSTAAELVRHQYWHKDQIVEEVEGGIYMRLPVSDFREITMKILQYGAMARVVGPAELKKKVQAEISQMAEMYSQPEKQAVGLINGQ